MGHPGMIIVDRRHYQELFNATGNQFSMMHAYIEDFHFPSVFRADIFEPIHANAIRSKLTHNIPVLTPQIVDEVSCSIDEEMGTITKRYFLFNVTYRRLDPDCCISSYFPNRREGKLACAC
jgi:hypothetical protein